MSVLLDDLGALDTGLGESGVVIPHGGCEDCNRAARAGGETWTKWCRKNPFWLRKGCYGAGSGTEVERLNWCAWHWCR